MRILQICHKPPLPLIDGGCIAIHNLSKGLMEEFNSIKILTISTLKHPFDEKYYSEDYLNKTKIESVFVDTKLNIVDAFSNLITYDSYNVSRFFSPDFNDLLIKTLKSDTYDIILLESLFTTPYIQTIRSYSSSKIILRSHNLEHIIWKRLAKETSNPAKKIYLNLLSNQLKTYEINTLKDVNGIVSISKEDEKKYKNIDCPAPITSIPFGIDIQNYIPKKKKIEKKLRFFHLGAMDWKPNLEAVGWLLKEIWPKILEKEPNAELHLAGKNMPEWLINITDKSVINHGKVESAIDFMNENDIMLVPLLSAGGIRVKIIEGMALGKAIISTSIGAEGLNYTDGENIVIANDPKSFAEKAHQLNENLLEIPRIGENARVHVSEYYDQSKITKKLVKFCESI